MTCALRETGGCVWVHRRAGAVRARQRADRCRARAGAPPPCRMPICRCLRRSAFRRWTPIGSTVSRPGPCGTASWSPRSPRTASTPRCSTASRRSWTRRFPTTRRYCGTSGRPVHGAKRPPGTGRRLLAAAPGRGPPARRPRHGQRRAHPAAAPRGSAHTGSVHTLRIRRTGGGRPGGVPACRRGLSDHPGVADAGVHTGPPGALRRALRHRLRRDVGRTGRSSPRPRPPPPPSAARAPCAHAAAPATTRTAPGERSPRHDGASSAGRRCRGPPSRRQPLQDLLHREARARRLPGGRCQRGRRLHRVPDRHCA